MLDFPVPITVAPLLATSQDARHGKAKRAVSLGFVIGRFLRGASLDERASFKLGLLAAQEEV